MILRTENIKKSYGTKKVLNGISLTVQSGKLIGIVGENGAGKSTLVNILVGLLKADAGHLSINCSLGYCPQLPLVFSQLTVLENLKYFAAAYRLYDTKNKETKYADYLLKLFRFDNYKHKQVVTLSGGTMQKLNLVIALMHQPKLLILDEPYNGFDWETYLCFWDFVKQFKANGGSVLLVTHLLTDTSAFDDVYNLKMGVLT